MNDNFSSILLEQASCPDHAINCRPCKFWNREWDRIQWKSETCRTNYNDSESGPDTLCGIDPNNNSQFSSCASVSFVFCRVQNEIRWTRVCKASWELQFQSNTQGQYTLMRSTLTRNTPHKCTLHTHATCSLGKVFSTVFVLLNAVQVLQIYQKFVATE